MLAASKATTGGQASKAQPLPLIRYNEAGEKIKSQTIVSWNTVDCTVFGQQRRCKAVKTFDPNGSNTHAYLQKFNRYYEEYKIISEPTKVSNRKIKRADYNDDSSYSEEEMPPMKKRKMSWVIKDEAEQYSTTLSAGSSKKHKESSGLSRRFNYALGKNAYCNMPEINVGKLIYESVRDMYIYDISRLHDKDNPRCPYLHCDKTGEPGRSVHSLAGHMKKHQNIDHNKRIKIAYLSSKDSKQGFIPWKTLVELEEAYFKQLSQPTDIRSPEPDSSKK
ncbi:MAG: hypothetical protein OXD32_02275 [Endozoicomonadaceae bacterium]|nr:hypothetical protein [Endozoicomonadaceae bacterium]MCY4330894.1 hypothetical protein [Endozoicomonadaceae bacterium]